MIKKRMKMNKMLEYFIYILLLWGAVAFSMLLFRCWIGCRSVIKFWITILKIYLKIKYKTCKSKVSNFLDDTIFNRPHVVKKDTYRFKVDDDEYVMKINKHYSKSLFDLIAISDETSRDVGERVLTLAGPFLNFYGIVHTPQSLGYEYLYVNGSKIEGDEPIKLVNYL